MSGGNADPGLLAEVLGSRLTVRQPGAICRRPCAAARARRAHPRRHLSERRRQHGRSHVHPTVRGPRPLDRRRAAVAATSPSLAMHAGIHLDLEDGREYVAEQLVGSFYLDFRNGLNWTPVAAALAGSLRAPSRGDPPRTCWAAPLPGRTPPRRVHEPWYQLKPSHVSADLVDRMLIPSMIGARSAATCRLHRSLRAAPRADRSRRERRRSPTTCRTVTPLNATRYLPHRVLILETCPQERPPHNVSRCQTRPINRCVDDACRRATPQRCGPARTRGSPREGARSEPASAAATGGGGPQAPPTRTRDWLKRARAPLTRMCGKHRAYVCSCVLPSNPLRAVAPHFLLPDRHDLLQAIDRVARGLERFAAMRGGHGDHHRRLSDVQHTRAVDDRHAADRPTALHLVANLRHDLLGHLRIGLVLQMGDLAPA